MVTDIIKNKIKSVLILALVIVFFSVIIYFVASAFGMNYKDAALLAIFISLIMSVGSYWFSDKIVIKMSGAHQPTPEQMNYLKPIVENLCSKAKLPMPKIYVTDDNAPNAFATGRNHNHAVVCVTSGILNVLQKDELEGVIAHEIAHIKNYDILLQTVASVLLGAAMMAANIWGRSMMFGGRRRNNKESSGIISMLIGLVCVIIAPIAGQLIKLALSRNREYLADATGASFTGNPNGLAEALLKIDRCATAVTHANNATEGMYIANPLKSLKGNADLFSTHPPIAERVLRLRNLKV